MLRQLSAGFAAIGDVQFLPGYCVLLSDDAGAGKLTDLPRARRSHFLEDMDVLGEAVEIACAQRDLDFRRVNIEILGNTDSFLHAHVWPRFDWEPDHLRPMPVWLYPKEMWTSKDYRLSEVHDELRREIAVAIDHVRTNRE